MDQPDFTAENLNHYRNDHRLDIGLIEEVSKFSDGQSNPTYKLTTASSQYVLRAQPPGELLKSAHQVDREYTVMNALGSTNVPVPTMLHMSRPENRFGRKFFIMEFLDGRIFWDPALPELGDDAQSTRAHIYDAMNEALAALHSVDPNDVGLSEFGRAGNYFERQLSRWTKQYHASETEHQESIHALIKWLEANLPADDNHVSLVHGDYRLDNMIFAKDDEVILGILDWELSTLGHPIADLAYQCMQWRLPNVGNFRGLGNLDRTALGIPTEEEYVAAYCKRRNIEQIENWSFYVAFCFFRLAAILQGVYKRSLDGNASDPTRSKTYGAAVPVLGQMAMSMIKET